MADSLTRGIRGPAVLAAVLATAACGGAAPAAPSGGVASGGSVVIITATAAPSGASGQPAANGEQRTVITPIGLNVRSAPDTSASRVASAGQGAVLTVLGSNAQNGGWLQVKGATTSGWVSADPSLTSPHLFQLYQSDAHAFGALYRSDWTFAESPAAVIVKPQNGDDRITVTTLPSVAALSTLTTGYAVSKVESVVVCGVTTVLRQYSRGSGAPAAGADSPRLASIPVAIDATHVLGVTFGFSSEGQLTDLRDFLNSVSFVSPVCLHPTTP